MTQRSMPADDVRAVVVRAGASVTLTGWKNSEVSARTDGRWGLKLERRGDRIEVHLGGSGEVYVPLDQDITVYAGKNADIQGVRGRLTLSAGWRGTVRDVQTLVHATAGRELDVACDAIAGQDVSLSSGGSLRCAIRTLTDARLLVNDLGGYWEGQMGAGRVTLRLKAGGDVTLVTNQPVVSLSPHGLIGHIEPLPA